MTPDQLRIVALLSLAGGAGLIIGWVIQSVWLMAM